jgi:hypothetical protein
VSGGSFGVSSLLRRLGIKSGEHSFPVVPGVFPTVQLGDASRLVAGPPESRSVFGKNVLVAGAASYLEFYFGGANLLVRNLILGTTEPSVCWVLDKSAPRTGGAALARVEVGEIPSAGYASSLSPVGVSPGAPLGIGTLVLQDLNWRVEPGEQLIVRSVQNPNFPYLLYVSADVSELPTGSIQP